MSDLARDAALVAAGSAFVFLGKLLDKAFGWRRSREDLATTIRNELRQESGRLNARIATLEASVNDWREKYLAEKELNGKLRVDYEALQRDHSELKDDFESLKKRLSASGVTP